MTIKAGVDFILKIEDPDDAEALITVAALTTVSVSFSNSFVDVSDLLQHTQPQPTDAGQRLRSTSVSASGFASDDASRLQLIALLESGALFNVTLYFNPSGAPSADTLPAVAKLTSLSFDGGASGAQNMSCAMVLYDATHEVINYVTWNPLDKNQYATLSNNNFTLLGQARATQGYTTGRYYYELQGPDTSALDRVGVSGLGHTLVGSAGVGPDGGPAVAVRVANGSFNAAENQFVDGHIGTVQNLSGATSIGVAVDFDHGILELFYFETFSSVPYPPDPYFITGFPTGSAMYPVASGGVFTTLNSGQLPFVGTPPATYAHGLVLPAPTHEDINTEAANNTTWTIIDRANRDYTLAIYPDGLTAAQGRSNLEDPWLADSPCLDYIAGAAATKHYVELTILRNTGFSYDVGLILMRTTGASYSTGGLWPRRVQGHVYGR
jgi:predicted secreted protein